MTGCARWFFRRVTFPKHGPTANCAIRRGGDLTILRLKSYPTARLILTDAADRQLIPSRAEKLDVFVSNVSRGRLIAWPLAAVASVALITFVLVPVVANCLAEYLPPAGEKALWRTTFEQIRMAVAEAGFTDLTTCDRPEGRAALQKIEDHLTAELDLSTPLTVHMPDHEMVNAFALPGGYVAHWCCSWPNGLSKPTTPKTPRPPPTHLPIPPCWAQTCHHLPSPHSFRD